MQQDVTGWLNSCQFSLKALESKNFSVQSWKYTYFFHYHSLYAEKNGHYAGIMLDAPTIALCPKICRRNVSNPSICTHQEPLENLLATGRDSKEDGKPNRARGIIVNYSVQDCGPGGELSEEED